MDKILIHPSTLDKLSSCKLQHYWSRRYSSLIVSEPLIFGEAIHYALERRYTKGESALKAYEQYVKDKVSIPELEDTLTLGKAMMENYEKEYAEEAFEVLAVEKDWQAPVPVPVDEEDKFRYKGRFEVSARIDAVVRDLSSGQVFVLEHKTFSNFYPANLSLNHQFAIEKYIAEYHMKVPVAGLIYNGLRKKATPGPTTKLFERHYLYINDQQVSTMLHRVYWQLVYMNSNDYRVYPEPDGMKCNFCSFKAPCTEYLRGGDYQFILNTTYTERKDKK